MSMISFIAAGWGAQIDSGVEGFPRGGVRGAQGGAEGEVGFDCRGSVAVDRESFSFIHSRA